MPTIQAYRNRFKWHNDGHPWIQLPDMEFLQRIGAYRIDKEKGEEGFTRAGVMMFGKTESNPGRMLVSIEEYYAGSRSKCRNPLLQTMFRLVGYGEKAGSGADIIAQGWAENHWARPTISETLIPGETELVLTLQKMKEKVKETSDTTLQPYNLTTLQANNLTSLKKQILAFCVEWHTIAEIAEHVQRSRQYLRGEILPTIKDQLDMLHPEKPNHPKQQYRVKQ